MKNWMDEDNILNIWLLKLWDLVLANLLFVLFSLPLVTLGPALTALYFCMLKEVKGEGGQVLRHFIGAFRCNLRRALVWELLVLLPGLLLSANLVFLQRSEGPWAGLFYYLSIGLAFALLMLAQYIFPQLAAFELSGIQPLRNALIFMLSHLPGSLALLALSVLPLWMSWLDVRLWPLYAFCWFFFGFALTALGKAFILYRIFKPHLEGEINRQ